MSRLSYKLKKEINPIVLERDGYKCFYNNCEFTETNPLETGPGFSSPNQPVQERATAYRDGSGSNLRSDPHYATINGYWDEPSGESRLKRRR